VKPLDKVMVNIYGSGAGNFNLYEDDEVSLKYKDNQYSWTPLTYSTDADGSHRVVIGPTKGSFSGQVQKRSYQLHVSSIKEPQSVLVDGKSFKDWNWDAGTSTAIIRLPLRGIRQKVVLNFK